MSEKKQDYKKDLGVDKHNLDWEWVRQALLFMSWGELHAKAIFERDRARENLDVVRAELDAAIRANPLRYDWPDDKKPTESFISNTILNQEGYKQANLALTVANESVNILATAKEAFQHKRSALENLTRLFLANYFAEDVPKEAKESIERKSHEHHKQALEGSSRLKRLKERRVKKNDEKRN